MKPQTQKTWYAIQMLSDPDLLSDLTDKFVALFRSAGIEVA